jgi:hypothetical protein
MSVSLPPDIARWVEATIAGLSETQRALVAAVAASIIAGLASVEGPAEPLDLGLANHTVRTPDGTLRPLQPTAERLLRALADGQWHNTIELFAALDQRHPSGNLLRQHIFRLRQQLEGTGLTIETGEGSYRLRRV